jgi:tRNA pseudouridine32 synthase/23S rRNA pseudouridine746 synthase
MAPNFYAALPAKPRDRNRNAPSFTLNGTSSNTLGSTIESGTGTRELRRGAGAGTRLLVLAIVMPLHQSMGDKKMHTSDQRLELHITVEVNGRDAVDLLHAAAGLSKQAVKSAMTNGAVWLTRKTSTRRLRRAKRIMQVGDQLHLYYDPKVQAEVPPEPSLVADVGGYSVWRKPYGMRSQGSKWGDHCTIMRWAEQHLQPQRPSFTVHRLDRAANGLILVAHSKACAAALAKLFRNRQIDKRYRAVVQGDFSNQPAPLRIESPIDGKTALSEVTFLSLNDDTQRSLVEVKIETGRKHQIRRHLADAGFAIVGDRLYGNGEQDGCDLQLTASRLAFECPVTNEPVVYTLPMQ